MPELPEVETVRRGLAPILIGQAVDKVVLNRANLRFAIPPKLDAAIKGQRVTAVSRRAKFLFFEMENRGVCVAHLGMTGRFRIEGVASIGEAAHAHPAAILPQHDHVVFHLSNGARLIYNDIRRFGFIDWFDGPMSRYPRLLKFGPEPCSDGFDAAYLWGKCRASAAPLKALLLNQNIVAGLGNIYVCEALFRAGIAPTRLGNSLTKGEAGKLITHIDAVISAAIVAGGSTLKDFAHADGSAGYFQHAFDVYGREGKSCNRCETPIERISQSNRSSFYCPVCQK